MVIKQYIINMHIQWKDYLKHHVFSLEHSCIRGWICTITLHIPWINSRLYCCLCLYLVSPAFLQNRFFSPSLRYLIRIEALLPALPLPLSRSHMFFDVEFKAAANVFFIWHTFCWASCPPLLCKQSWRRMVMTLALWDSKWVKFKRSLYITAPVNQTWPVPECVACVFTCLVVCMLLSQGVMVGGSLVGGIEGSKNPGLVQYRTGCSSAYLSFCQLLTPEIWASETRLYHQHTHKTYKKYIQITQCSCLTLTQITEKWYVWRCS